MKTTSVFRWSLFVFFTSLFALGLLLSTGCKKDNNNNSSAQMYTTTGDASGTQENPAVTTSGTGTMNGTYDAATNAWQYNISWTSLSGVASAVELHGPADAGANGSLVVALTITTSGASGSASGTITLTEQQEADLLAGKYYYNILTASNVTGEIRGQIHATAQ